MPQSFEPADPARFEAALSRFDLENSLDPNRELFEGQTHPRELLYARWLTQWVLRLCPEASEPLRLAARCQHLRRWQLPRASYPASRAGYLRWRQELKELHAQQAGAILRELGYPQELVERVQQLNLKANFPHEPESQVLEDALCLVFLERQLGPLADKSSEDKLLNALRKSWKKMSPRARQLAQGLSYGPREQQLLQKALAEPGPGSEKSAP